jgi:hypothetical protein
MLISKNVSLHDQWYLAKFLYNWQISHWILRYGTYRYGFYFRNIEFESRPTDGGTWPKFCSFPHSPQEDHEITPYTDQGHFSLGASQFIILNRPIPWRYLNKSVTKLCLKPWKTKETESLLRISAGYLIIETLKEFLTVFENFKKWRKYWNFSSL